MGQGDLLFSEILPLPFCPPPLSSAASLSHQMFLVDMHTYDMVARLKHSGWQGLSTIGALTLSSSVLAECKYIMPSHYSSSKTVLCAGFHTAGPMAGSWFVGCES